MNHEHWTHGIISLDEPDTDEVLLAFVAVDARPVCACCKHREGCGYHHGAKPEDWDPIVGAGCMCPEPPR